MSYLIRFRVCFVSLQVYSFLDAILKENVMATTRSLLEPQQTKQMAQFIKSNIGIGSPSQNTPQKILILSHFSRILKLRLPLGLCRKQVEEMPE